MGVLKVSVELPVFVHEKLDRLCGRFGVEKDVLVVSLLSDSLECGRSCFLLRANAGRACSPGACLLRCDARLF
jgi:hypothetical protein